MYSEVASIVFIALFTIAALIVFILNVRSKTWFFMSLVVAAALEILGMSFKIVTKYYPTSVPFLILYILPVLVAPTIFAIAGYSSSIHLFGV